MKNDASSVLFRRLPYMLSPQLDIYEKLPPLAAGGRVLEIGFGTGIGVLQYAEAASWVDAIEIDPAAVRFARRCFPLANVLWEQTDIENIIGLGRNYDLIVMIEVLEHIEVPDRALRSIAMLLKTGGVAIVTVPNMHRHRKKDEVLNIHEWSTRMFQDMLERHFEIEIQQLTSEFKPHKKIDHSETPLIARCS